MTKAKTNGSSSAWVEAGSQLAEIVRDYHAIAVIGDDGEAAAGVARGIGGAVASGRRVIVADLVGDVPVLRELSADPDPEGVADSFTFGTSLNKIARHTPIDNLLFIPSGGEPVEREEIFRSGRWARLAKHCRTTGSLLLVAARAAAAGLDALVEQLDGALLLGTATAPTGVHVLHRVETPLRGEAAPAASRTQQRVVAGAGITIALAAILSFAAWQAYRSNRSAVQAPTATPPAPVVVPDTQATSLLVPINSADSLRGAGYAIEMMSANTRNAANFELQRHRQRFPAATLSALPVGAARSTWYRIVVGAFAEARQADSLLRSARQRGLVGDSVGMVFRAPLALLVDSAPSRGQAQPVIARYTLRGLPAYGLLQSDGRVFVYVGAFNRREDVEPFAEELSASGLEPVLAYRMGRVL